jgi:hypothetical protein
MSIAQSLPDVHPFFMQDCPLCGRSNRIVVKGVYVKDDKAELYPDMGYSFCNCRAIFYTRPENVTEPFQLVPDGKEVTITQPDPFFVEWGQNPYTFTHWNPRRYQILWDMESLVEEFLSMGWRVFSYYRDFDVNSKTPQHFHIHVRKS